MPGHPLRLGLDPPQGVPGVGPGVLPSAPRQFGVPADRGERRTQLMAGVRDELPYPRLALLPRVQRRTDVARASG